MGLTHAVWYTWFFSLYQPAWVWRHAGWYSRKSFKKNLYQPAWGQTHTSWYSMKNHLYQTAWLFSTRVGIAGNGRSEPPGLESKLPRSIWASTVDLNRQVLNLSLHGQFELTRWICDEGNVMCTNSISCVASTHAWILTMESFHEVTLQARMTIDQSDWIRFPKPPPYSFWYPS